MDLNTTAELPNPSGQQQQQDHVSDQQVANNDARARNGQPDQQQNQNQQQQQQNQKPPYTIPGILHYLQYEWHRFEVERQEWEVEKAELSARIALLQGEKKSHENLRHDLIRRIKMLEYCLRMERAKYHRLKHGTDPPPIESLTSNSDTNDQQHLDQGQQQDGSKNATDSQQQQLKSNTQQPQLDDGFLNNNSSTITYGRELLKHYLQEIGYTDTIIDLRSNRVRSLLGIVDYDQSPGSSQQGSQVSCNDNNASNNSSNTSASTTNTSNNVNRLLANNSEGNNEAAVSGFRTDNSDYTSAITTQNITSATKKSPFATKLSSSNPATTTSKMTTSASTTASAKQRGEADNAESTVLATFGFLYDHEGLKESSQLGDDDDDDNDEEDAVSDDIVDAADRAASTTSEYSYIDKEYSDATAIIRQKLDLLNDVKSPSSNISDQRRDLATRMITTNSDLTQSNLPSSTANNANNWCPQPENNDAVDIGELASLTTLGSETNGNDLLKRRRWSNKFRLQSHFDCVRDIKFTNIYNLIVTASEDETLKLWSVSRQNNASGKTRQLNLPPSISSLELSLTDKEPLHTFRGHKSRVLSLAVDEDYIYSGAQDGEIIQWKIIKNASADLYSKFDESLLVCRLLGHEDAVWSLEIVDYNGFTDFVDNKTQPSRTSKKSNWLHSVSADLTMRIWSTAGADPRAYKVIKLESSPTCIVKTPRYNQYKNADVAIASCDGKIRLYNTKEIDLVNSSPSEVLECDDPHRINSIVIHPTLPYLVSADSNRSIKFWDLISKKCESAMVAHLDEVTSLAFDPTGKFLLSASHDCSARMWLFKERACIQEITSHRKKFDEGIFAVAFNPRLSEFATAGADGLAKVYSSIN